MNAHDGGAVPPGAAARTRDSAFGRQLRQTRQSHGLTLCALATSVGMSEAYLSQVERGIAGPPSVEVASRMAAVLDIQADAFLAAAGRLSPDIVAVILRHPAEMSRLIRCADRWSRARWADIESRLIAGEPDAG